MSDLPISGKKPIQEPLLHSKHAKYFLRFLNLLPARLASQDSTRGTIVFFSVCGLDILSSLHLLDKTMRQRIIDWLYGGLFISKETEPKCDGFQSARSIVLDTTDEKLLANARSYQMGHLAMTYTAISVLATLGDDFSRLNRKKIVEGVAAVQQSDGSFSACINGIENDMRFVFCAAAICHMLDFWGEVSKEKMFQFIKNSIRYDYGFSQHLEGESHGGTTFCALAALQLSGQLHRLDAQTIEGIKRWLVLRQVDGFQGRPNKPVDTCYSFWIGSALKILNAFELCDYDENRKYILETQDKVVGGFAKWPESGTDPFHTYFGICGLSFMQEPNLSAVMPSLNISMSAYNYLQQLHAKWRTENVDDEFVTATNVEDKENITSQLIAAQ